jgi:hypothetical protein
MNDLDELRRHVLGHARVQDMAGAEYEAVLSRITNDDGDTPGSWVAEWTRTGEGLAREGKHLEALRHFNIARFPYVDGPARAAALNRAIQAFDRWRRAVPGIERLDVDLPGGRVRCWTAGLSGGGNRPLLLMMGGIVTIKEQYAPLLAQAEQLDLAGVVTEIPGAGENTLRYDADSPAMVSAVLDAIADRTDVSRTYAIALSFAGHLVLRAALADGRIRGVVTTGAPIGAFFTDAAWQARLPKLTRDTLAHVTGTAPDAVGAHIRGWELTAGQIAALDIPIAYVASTRDEIVPPADLVRLRGYARHLDMIEKDDVHGAPGHVDEVRLWTLLSALRMCGDRPAQAATLEAALGALGQPGAPAGARRR